MKKRILIIFFLIFLSSCTEFSNEPHVILSPGYDTVEVGDEWIDEGAFLQVGFDRFAMETSDTVDTDKIGFYDIHYEVIHEGITYDVMRRVAVVEKTQINASLNPGLDTIYVGEIWMDAGVTVPEGATVETTGEVSFITPGTYEISYEVTLDDLSVTLVRYVNVLSKN